MVAVKTPSEIPNSKVDTVMSVSTGLLISRTSDHALATALDVPHSLSPSPNQLKGSPEPRMSTCETRLIGQRKCR